MITAVNVIIIALYIGILVFIFMGTPIVFLEDLIERSKLSKKTKKFRIDVLEHIILPIFYIAMIIIAILLRG